MKTFVSIVFFVLFSVMSSFSQIYVIHVDTTVEFKHPATITTLQAMKNDMVTYTGGGATSANYTINFDNMTLTSSFFTGFSSTVNIVNKINTSEFIELEAITEKGNIAHIVVDKGKKEYEGMVIYVRWNTIENGIPVTKGWASRNVVVTKKGVN